MSSAVQIRSISTIAEAALSFVGAGIAGTLWRFDTIGENVPCSAGGGCDIVNHSHWSHIDLLFFHSIPVALLGLVGYVLLLTLSMLRIGSDNRRLDSRLHQLIWLVSGGGVVYSWYLQWVAHAEIGAFCIWCRSSAIVMTLLFAAASWEFLSARPQRHRGQEIHG